MNKKLWFDSAQTAIIGVQIANVGETARELEFAWVGSVFADASLKPTEYATKLVHP